MHVSARTPRLKRPFLIGIAGIVAILIFSLIGVKSYFPLRHSNQILQLSTAYDLAPAWVGALIRCESNYEHDAVSSAGAVGLMQLMPPTATWIAHQMQWDDPTDIDLQDVTTNLTLGCWYLRYLLDRFGRLETALMAYNAGPTRAEEWLATNVTPFPETTAYVHRVQRYVPVYSIYFRFLWLANLIPSVRVPY